MEIGAGWVLYFSPVIVNSQLNRLCLCSSAISNKANISDKVLTGSLYYQLNFYPLTTFHFM
jgi:hypothetical protein